MNWKATVALTGATAVAGWLGFGQPQPPSEAVSTRGQSAHATPMSEIEREAVRLQARGRERPEFHEPSRNLFRFGARLAPSRGPAPRAGGTPSPEVEVEDEPLPPVVPQPPVIALSGIASETVDGEMRRTAILRTPQGMVMVRQGAAVAGEYRVERIEADAVHLVSTRDGSSRRVGF